MNILSIDIGGTGLKAGVLDYDGNMISERVRVKTAHPITAGQLIDALVDLVAPLPPYDRVSVGFPGVVRGGKIITAPNLGTDALRNFDLAGTLEERLGKPVHVLNDCEMQGLAAIEGEGFEMVITLGTGFGSALFLDGKLGPHLELSHHPFRKGEDYDQQLGVEALQKIGKKKWNRRVQIAIDTLRVLTNFDKLYIGGGNAAKIEFDLPADIKIVPNELGIKGGAFLWRDRGQEAAVAPLADSTDH